MDGAPPATIMLVPDDQSHHELCPDANAAELSGEIVVAARAIRAKAARSYKDCAFDERVSTSEEVDCAAMDDPPVALLVAEFPGNTKRGGRQLQDRAGAGTNAASNSILECIQPAVRKANVIVQEHQKVGAGRVGSDVPSLPHTQTAAHVDEFVHTASNSRAIAVAIQHHDDLRRWTE